MKPVPRYVAVHEAAHAVASIVLGSRSLDIPTFEFVCIGEQANPTHTGRGYLDRGSATKWKFSSIEYATILMAGHAAEVAISHRPLFPMGWTVSEDARVISKELGIPWEDAYAAARKLVRQNRSTIIAVADRLLTVRRLEYAEVLSIVNTVPALAVDTGVR